MVVRELGGRHDVGSVVVRRVAERASGGAFKAHRARALVDEVRLGSSATGGSPGPRLVLAVPTVYMNESGGSVSALLKYYSTDLDHLVVVHDELDIPAGVVRVKRGGGEGGHNGLRSVSASLGSRDYLRVRVGIGRPPGRMDPADFVLRNFSAAESAELPLTVDSAADAVESLVEVGLLETQQRFHAP
jgi:PTH1 family peptidyl-tRNA hydrolase